MVAKKMKDSCMTLARTLVLVFVVFAVIGCSSSSDTTPTEGELAEADLFDGLKEDAEVSSTQDPYASAETDESELESYADDNIVSSGSASSSEDGSETVSADGSYDYYYRAIGGESVRHIAYALYSSGKASGKLLRMNSGLSAQTPVPSDTRVYFDMGSVSPRAEMLTKDLIERYGSQLSERLRLKRSQQFGNEEYMEVTVQRGDTLQAISERIYGTTRLWTELYLLNQERIANYDQLQGGTILRYYPKTDYVPPVVVAKNDTPTMQTPVTPAQDTFEQERDSFESEFAEETKQAKMDVDVTDSVGETDPFAETPPPAPKPKAVAKPVVPDPVVAEEQDPFAEEDQPIKKVTIKKTPMEPVESPDTNIGSNPVVSGGVPVDTQKEEIKTGLEKEAGAGGTIAKNPDPPINRFRQNKQAEKRPKTLRPPERQASVEESGGVFAQNNLRRFIYIGIVLFILVGGYFLTRPSRGFKKSKFGGIQPMPTPKAAPPRPKAAPSPRNRGSAPPGPRPNQRTGTGS